MLFPVSGVETNPAVPFLVALVVSSFTSMGGSLRGFFAPAFSGERPGFYQSRRSVPPIWSLILSPFPAASIAISGRAA